MHVCIVSPFDPFMGTAPTARAHVGGVERVLREFAHRLASRGHDVSLVCSSAWGEGDFAHEGIRVLRRRRRTTVFRAPVASLADAVPADADVVHVPATYPFTTGPVLRRCHERGTPAVLDFHFEPAPGTLVGRWAARAYRHLGPRAYATADAVLVRSRSYAAHAPSLGTVDADRLHVVPNGVDVERFRPAPAPRKNAHVLFVGRLVPYKGVEVLLDALATRPVDVPLLVAGDGPLRRRLEREARALGVRARFLGAVDDGQLVRLYQDAAVTVLPSVTGQEAFGMALLESMACGTPVVASSLPGVADLALNGGFVVRPRDPDRLATHIARACQTGVLPQGPALSRRIHDAYSWEAVTDRLERVYDTVLGRTAAAGDAGREVSVSARPGHQPVL